MSNARHRLDALVRGLRENPRIELLNHELTDPLTSDRIGELADGLPAGVEEFYREVGSFKLEWRSTEGDGTDRGVVDILPLDRVLGDWSGITWFPSGEQEFRPVVPFDFFTPEACAAFERGEDGTFAEEVSYHYFGEELAPTGRTFTEYVDLLIASRGYWYWPKTLCAGYEDSAEVTDFRQNMPRLFPDHDDGLFRPR
ncbi:MULTISPECIES: hypothetical protein [unclassified Streptomyces]|uniref:hypothetical protein n=1 Tax=unclassified Streptomyces TaxID=2593676 RepID=UPI002ED5A2E1|nr:hypothetical protein OH827_19580 [Streptomyces sp. NBC_00891]WSY07067.1 hypothetical protein OG464_19580 [Streptomyces sp. NBC_00890]WSZ08694.1 hypothetical protein OG704_19585 [Streptomyces sp. NBC_00869]WSZ23808.1 hypothetical protein OG498_13985 [Streptomyces sp. NBC_00870]